MATHEQMATAGIRELAAQAEALVSQLMPMIDDLENALTEESRALAGRNPIALLEAVDVKRRRLADIEAAVARHGLVQLIDRIAESAGRADRDAGRALSRHVPSWSAFVERLTQCRIINRAIGASTVSLLRGTTDSLSLLGISAEPAEYGTSGQRQSPRQPSRPIVC